MASTNPTSSPSESSPLLSKPTTADTIPTTSANATPPRTRCTWPYLPVILLVILIGTISSMGEDFLAAPKIRLFESVLCADYYQHHPDQIPVHLQDHAHMDLARDPAGQVPERWCKIPAIQDELAAVMGGQFFFDAIPAILFPVPFGWAADRFGRKWILVASGLGVTLSYAWTLMVVGVFQLPLRWVWFSSAFSVVGGGLTVGTYILTTIAADVVPAEVRTTVFFYRYCTDSIADLIIPPVTSYLMTRNLWIPLILATAFMALACIASIFIPETAPLPRSAEHRADEESYLRVSHDSTDEEDSTRKRIAGTTSTKQESSFAGSFSFFTQNGTLIALVGTFLLTKIGRQALNMIIQYVSTRYDWTLATAGLLKTLMAIVNLALYTAILPALAAYILKRVGIPAVRDLSLARGSALVLFAGAAFVCIAMTPTLMIIGVVLFTLGLGFPHATRSLMTSITEANSSGTATSDIARLYAIISVAEGLGSLIEALAMSWTYRLGLRLGHNWQGLPFGLAAVLFLLVAIITFSIRTKHLR